MEKMENIEIKRMLDIFSSKKIIIGIILLFSIVCGYLYSYHYIVPKYQSTETLLLVPDSASETRAITSSDLTVNSGLITTYSKIATNGKVLKKVIENLKLDMTEKELLSNIQVNTAKDTYVIEIGVTNEEPQKAMEIAKEISNVFLEEIKGIYRLDNIGIVDEAQLPKQPYNINHKKDIIMFLAIGMMVVAGYTSIVYLIDNTLKTEVDIEKYIDIKSLGIIPIHEEDKKEILDRKEAKSYITECINTIRTNILYRNTSKNAKTILITSCTPREGKS